VVTALAVSLVSLLMTTVGAVTGVVALAWQIRTRREGTHNVLIRLGNAVTTIDSRMTTLYSVEVINRGSAGVQMLTWDSSCQAAGYCRSTIFTPLTYLACSVQERA
jgi:hypothetical protein